MPNSGIYVEGLRDCVKGLEQIGVEVDDLKAVFAKISGEAAQVIAAETPVGKTGKLRASVRGNRAKNKAVVTAGRARVPYATAINYGWGTGSVSYVHGGRRNPNIKGNYKGREFMQAADRKMADRIPDLIEEGIGDIIRKHGFEG